MAADSYYLHIHRVSSILIFPADLFMSIEIFRSGLELERLWDIISSIVDFLRPKGLWIARQG